jgi:hypothetical protein
MTWIDFFLYLALFYAAYYAINVVTDLLRSPQILDQPGTETYTFQNAPEGFEELTTIVEDDEPEIAKKEPVNSLPSKKGDSEETEFVIIDHNPVKSSGGVTSLDEILDLAKSDMIEMKKKVVFS